MNKKLLGLAVAAVFASGTAVAGEVYSSDAATVSLSGEVKATGANISTSDNSKDENLAVSTSAKLSVSATHQLTDAVELGASFDVKDDSDVFQDVKIYGSGDFGKLTLGATGNSFGVTEKAKVGEGDSLYAVSQGGVDDNGVRYEKSFGDVAFSANYATQKDSKKDSAYATSLNYSGDSYNVGVAYGSDGDDANTVGVAADVSFGDVTVSAGYINFENVGSLSANENSIDLDDKFGKNDGKTYALSLKYVMGDTTLFASAQKADADTEKKGQVEAQTVYAGATYAVTSQFSVFGVYQTGELEESGKTVDSDKIKLGAKFTF